MKKQILKENNESDEKLENLSFCQNEILNINWLFNKHVSSGQGPTIQITSLRKVTVGITGGGRRGWDPCVYGFSFISWGVLSREPLMVWGC
jgi:hypothetical protein